MSRRNLLLLILICPVVVLAACIWLMWPRQSSITHANVARIQNGMVLAEVEALLGGPPRDETATQGIVFYVIVPNRKVACERVPDRATWVGPEQAVKVDFCDGRVCEVMVGRTELTVETLNQRICRLLGL
jgi:hypothetical protein